MPLPRDNIYTSEDYWNLPEGQRAELIDGKLYDMAPPSYVQQKLVSEFTVAFSNHIKSKGGSCDVIPAPFAVNLTADDETYIEPDLSIICDKSKLTAKERTTIYRYEEDAAPTIIPFDQTIQVGIYSDLRITISDLL